MKAKVQRWLTAGMAALGAVFITHSASAAVPWTITHQGRLYNATGAPVTKTLDVVFTIYADEGGETELWKEARALSFEEGYFSVALGEDTPFGAGVFDGSVRYLGIKVGEDPEMTPRAAVRSVPYAILANDVSGDINPHSISIQGFGDVMESSDKRPRAAAERHIQNQSDETRCSRGSSRQDDPLAKMADVSPFSRQFMAE